MDWSSVSETANVLIIHQEPVECVGICPLPSEGSSNHVFTSSACARGGIMPGMSCDACGLYCNRRPFFETVGHMFLPAFDLDPVFNIYLSILLRDCATAPFIAHSSQLRHCWCWQLRCQGLQNFLHQRCMTGLSVTIQWPELNWRKCK